MGTDTDAIPFSPVQPGIAQAGAKLVHALPRPPPIHVQQLLCRLRIVIKGRRRRGTGV